MKLKVGKVEIDSMDDPTIHMNKLKEHYDPRPFGYNKIILFVTDIVSAHLVYGEKRGKRLLVQLTSNTSHDIKPDQNWVDNTLPVEDDKLVTQYERKTNWLTSEYKDD